MLNTCHLSCQCSLDGICRVSIYIYIWIVDAQKFLRFSVIDLIVAWSVILENDYINYGVVTQWLSNFCKKSHVFPGDIFIDI